MPALLIAILLFHIYKIIFPQTTFYFIIAGTATGIVVEIFIKFDEFSYKY